MRLNRIAALILALMMLFAAASLAEETIGETPGSWAAGRVYTGPEYDYDTLVVGHTTAMSGNFTTQMWGNNTSDLDVKALVNGYNLIRWDNAQGCFSVDESVVSGLTVYDDAQDNRTYLMALCQDLKYSDGTPINAYDYAFSMLLSVAEEIRQIGGETENYTAVLGMAEYKAGQAECLSGVRVLGEHMLSVTISSQYRPFFYEMGLLMCDPMPIHLIAPGCQVKDDGQGVYIQGEFTSQLLEKTMLDPVSGYVSHPAAVSGPYQLVSFDGVTAEFAINPEYKGNAEGMKPTIGKLVFTLAENETMIEKLEAGEFGLVNKALQADSVAQGISLVTEGDYAMQAYPRTGLSYIAFCCEKPTVSSQAVRQAIALCLNKDQLVRDYTGNYGLRVDGYYGIGQWMFQLVSGTLEPDLEEADQETLDAWEALSLEGMSIYDLDVEAAARLLEADGWTLNRQGAAFVQGVDDVRCKEIGGQLVALDLTMIYPEGNAIAASMQSNLGENLAQAGIVLTLEPVEFTQLLEMNYRRQERSCDMIYMASNFDVVFDPAPSFNPADAEAGQVNTTAIADEELYRLAKEMSATEPGDVLEYMTRWVAFQEYYTKALPAIPVYGNVYLDFHTVCLQDYLVSSNVTWSQAIVEAYMGDPVALEELEEGEEIFE